MNIIANNIVAKLAVAFVAVSMLVMVATPAKAATVDELEALIAQLTAQIEALTTSPEMGAGSAACTFTRSLTNGSEGTDVNCLQNYLTSTGHFNFSGGSTGYFGPVTTSAVAAWQAANGVAPAVGYFGPISQAKYNELMAAVPPVVDDADDADDSADDADDVDMTLSGGEGYLDFGILLDSNVAIDLGDTEEVLAVEVTAEDSDISISRVDFLFDARPWLYFDEVNLLIDGEEVASLDSSSDFSEIGTDYRARFTGLDAIVREDDSAEVTLELVVLDSMGGTRDTDIVNVSMTTTGVRFEDGAGITETGGVAMDADVSFDDTFGNGDMNLNIGENSPESETFVLDDNSRTEDQTVVAFSIEAVDSDVTVTDVEVEFSVATNTVATTLYRAYLYADGDLVGTESVGGTNVIFTDVDFMIDEDDEIEFTVDVDFNDGDTLVGLPSSFTVVDVEVDAEDEDFTALNDTLAVNEAHTILVDGIVAEIESITGTTANDGKQLTLTFEMDVTAYGADYYISATGSTAFAETITAPGTTTVSGSQVTVSGVTKSSVTNTYRISKGQTKTVSISYIVTDTVGGFVNAVLNTLTYGASAGTPTGETTTLGAPDFEKTDASVTAF